jgi:hypothetical protein
MLDKCSTNARQRLDKCLTNAQQMLDKGLTNARQIMLLALELVYVIFRLGQLR